MKYASYCFLLIYCIWAGTAFGTPVGNIADPACLTTGFFTHERPNGIFMSLEGDFVSDRKYRFQGGDFTLNTYGARIGGIFRDKYLVYGFLGLGEYSDSKSIVSYDLPRLTDRSERLNQMRISTGADLIYGVGVTAIMFEHKVNEGVFFRVGLDASYRRLQMEDDSAVLGVTVFNRPDTTTRGPDVVPGARYELTLNDYQGAVEVSYQVDNFIPYVGFMIVESRGNETIHVPNDPYYDYSQDIQLDENKGFFIGMTYNWDSRLSFNAEARTRTENAFTFSTVLRF